MITEAPSSSSGVLPLANFGTVNYSVSAANGTSLGTHSPVQIIMIDNSGAGQGLDKLDQQRRRVQQHLAARELTAHCTGLPGGRMAAGQFLVARCLSQPA